MTSAIAFADDPMVTVSAQQVRARANTDALVILNVSVKDGYHILSHDIGDDLIPTQVNLKDIQDVELLTAEYPDSKKFRLEGTDDFLDVYDGHFAIRIPIKVLNLPAGQHKLEGELRYQACDMKRCFFPKSVPFTVDLIII